MAIAINGAGTITGISAGGLPDGCIQAADLASGVGAGKCLQIVQTVKNDTFSAAVDVPTFVTGLSVTITPSATTSKILVTACVSATNDYGNNNVAFTLQRDSTQLTCKGDTAGSRQRATWQGNVTANAINNISS